MRYKLGRLAPRPVALGDLTHYMAEALPTPPQTVTAPDLFYPMALNDRYGDCTIAAVVHTDQVLSNLTGEPWTYPGDIAVARTYLGLTHGADSGLVETDVLKAWGLPGGLFGRQLAGWAPVNVRHTQVIKQTIALLGACYTGVLVPACAQQQFAAGQPWDLTGTSADHDIEGGHAVPAVGYNTTGPVFVTWGRLQQATWRWWAAYGEEAYAVITGEVKAKGVLRGLNFAALTTDLAALRVA